MERFTSAALRDVLEKVAPAIEAGGANLISVEAIRNLSSDKWPRKRDQVAVFMERAFSRVSQPGDFIVALNDAEFLTVQPSVSRTAALGVSAGILKETLAFFLGAAAREDIRLFQVMAFSGGALSLQPLDAVHILDGGEAPPWPATAPAGAPVEPPSDELDWVQTRRVRLTSPPNIELDLALTPEPTWNVGARVVASFLLRPDIWLTEGSLPERPATCAELSAQLAGEVAISGLEYASELIGQNGVQVALHAPIAWSAMTYSTTRYRLLHTLRDLPADVRRVLVLEITDLSAGLPQGRLAEVVGMLTPHCRAVLARAPSETVDVRAWRGCGLSGVTLDCRRLDAADRNSQGKLAAFARRAAEASLACVGYGLPATNLMLGAWAAGFTHLGGDVLSVEVPTPAGIVRLKAEDFLVAREAAASSPARA